MRDGTAALWNALRTGAPLTVVFYGDLGLRTELIERVESLAPSSWAVQRAASVDEALAAPSDALVMLLPDDEPEAVADLDGSRDRFIDRVAPVVVFLMRGGEGHRRLAQHPSFASWIRGSDVDPEEADAWDPEVAREEFEQETGQTPEAWLAARRGGGQPGSADEVARTYRALLLERTDGVG